MKPILAVVAAYLFAVPAFAAAPQWKAEMMRGVDTYSIQQDEYSVMLTCDPDKVFGVDNSSFSVRRGNTTVEGTFYVALNSPGAKTLKLNTTNGVAARSEMSENDWKALVDGLMAGTEFAVVTENMKPIFKPAKGFTARCF